jgi:hypothetical protein
MPQHIYAAGSLPPRLAVQLERSSLETPHCDTALHWGAGHLLRVTVAKVTTAGIAGLEEIGTLECLDGIGK